jgi:DNA replication protein DnaC
VSESKPGAATGEVGNSAGERFRLAIEEAAERDRLRRAQQKTSTARTAPSGPGKEALARRMRVAHVPEIYWQADWAKVRAPGVRDVADMIRWRCGDAHHPLRGRGAMLLGGTGTGKSSAAALICLEAARAGLSVAWEYVPTLMDKMLDAKGRSALLRRLVAVDLLVFDDLGVRAMADWEIGFMDQIVEGRYNRRMLVTGNLKESDLKEEGKAEKRMTRMVERWRERTAADFIGFAGLSMRV